MMKGIKITGGYIGFVFLVWGYIRWWLVNGVLGGYQHVNDAYDITESVLKTVMQERFVNGGTN